MWKTVCINRATCVYYPRPSPTGQTVKTVKKKFFSWIYPFHEISCNFGSGVFFTPPPTGQTVKTIFFMDLSISWNFLLMMTIACRNVGIWDQLVYCRWCGFNLVRGVDLSCLQQSRSSSKNNWQWETLHSKMHWSHAVQRSMLPHPCFRTSMSLLLKLMFANQSLKVTLTYNCTLESSCPWIIEIHCPLTGRLGYPPTG